MIDRQVRAYATLLRVYPRRFRSDYRDEMTRLFADQLRDVRSTEGAVGVVRLWVRSLVDLVLTAPGQHLEPEPVLVATPVGTPEPASARRYAVPRRRGVAVALIPLWATIALILLAPGFMDPLYANPPAILGLPAGIVLLSIALLWMAIGVGIVASARALWSQLAALWIFAVPATAAILLGPAVVLTIQNLAV
jgi:hypothetical protein